MIVTEMMVHYPVWVHYPVRYVNDSEDDNKDNILIRVILFGFV